MQDRTKMRGQKMKNRETQDKKITKNAGVENAILENVGQKSLCKWS